MSWDAPGVGPFAQLLRTDQLDEHAESRDRMALDALKKARRLPSGSDAALRWMNLAGRHESTAAEYRSLANARRGGGAATV